MRLRRLELRRYGHLSDVVLDFPSEAALCVVHGANETGKSTALAALGDALFGFRDLRSGPRPDFLHGAPQLRIGLTMQAQSGEEVAVVRRKGRVNTLTDEAGAPIPDDVMQRFLSGAGRETFENTFGLNGERLREGGRLLAQGGGSVGESLFAAGTGLLGLRAALARLDEEAKALVGRANGIRKLNVAVDRWRQAQKELERLSVAPRAWVDADKAHAAAVAELARSKARTDELRGQERGLQRMRRVAPLLVQLDAARMTAGELADAPRLPADAEETLRRHCAVRDQAAQDEERERGDAGRLMFQRDALVRNPGVMAVQDAVDRLVGQHPVAMQAEADRPGVQLQGQGLRAQVVQALADLPLSLTPEAARDALPPPAARRAVQRLVSKHAGLLATETGAKLDRDVAVLRRDQTEAALRASAVPSDPALLRLAIDSARAEGRLDDELAQATAVAEAARVQANQAFAALPRWTGTFEALAGLPLPLPADEAGVAVRLGAAADSVVKATGEWDRLTVEIQLLQESLAGFGPGGLVPTSDAVRAVRSGRDGAWRALRGILDGSAPTLPGAGPPILAFEALQAEADQVSDRRADEAQRVADYLQTQGRLASLRTRQASAGTSLADADRRNVTVRAEWAALWSPAMADPGLPAAMTEWRRARDAVVALSNAADAADRAQEQLRLRRDAAREGVVALLPEVGGEATLAAVLARAELVCTRRETDAETHRGLMAAVLRDVQAVKAGEDKAGAAGGALDAWRTEWAGAVAALGFTGPWRVEDAEAALAAWARIAEAAPAWRSAEDRVDQMTGAIDAFAAEVATVLAAMSQAGTGEPAPVAAARLARQLAEARSAEQSFTALSERVGAHVASADGARDRGNEAKAGIAALQALAGAADVSGLDAAISRARRRSEAEAEAVRLLGRVMEEGDGFHEPGLRLAAASYDPDQAAAQLDAIGEHLAELDRQREQCTAERTRMETVLDAMRHGLDAAAAAQDAHHALADARAAAERYARLHVARELLRSGIDRFRRSQQGPLLQAAGRHFAALTGHRYDRLAVDEDKDGRMAMLAVRGDGAECPVDALSEGTADQLFLALRVAMVEAHAASAEPLPFIADDLLVHFDDARAAQAIRLLAALGRTTQVILFSHHDHVAELAQGLASPEVAVVRLPGLGTGAVAGPRLAAD